jgi:predicted PurR-regulated permease PerM
MVADGSADLTGVGPAGALEPGPDLVTSGGTNTAATVARFRSARAPSTPFFIAVGLGVLVAIIFMLSVSALFVFAVGVAIAFFLVPVVNWLERRAWPRWLAAIATVAVTILGIVIIGLTVIGILVEQGIVFLQNLPSYLDDLGAWYAGLDLPEWLRSGIDSAIGTIQANLADVDQGAVLTGLIGSALDMLGGLFAWFLLPFFLFYLLKDQPKMAGTFYERVPAPWKDDVDRILTISVGNFAQYFKAEFLVGSIMFVLVTIGMLVIGIVTDSPLLIQFSLLLGLLAFIFELIPQIGPILSYIPALLLALASGVEAVVLVSVFYFIVFNIEGSVLVPTFEGKMISFSGASVLVLIAIGFAVGGIIGAIVALPLASIVRDIARLLFDKAVEKDLVLEPVAAAPTGTEPAAT